MVILGGLLGKLVRHCYAVLCFGVLLVSVTIAHYVPAAEPSDPRERTSRRLRASHGPPIHPSQSQRVLSLLPPVSSTSWGLNKQAKLFLEDRRFYCFWWQITRYYSVYMHIYLLSWLKQITLLLYIAYLQAGHGCYIYGCLS